MFCKNCGEYIRGTSAYCPRCKSLLLFSRRKNLDKELLDEYCSEKDRNSVGADVISFIMPIIGILLYFLNKDTFPRKSRSIGESLILGCIVWAAVIVAFSLFQWSDIEFFTNVQDLLVVNV